MRLIDLVLKFSNKNWDWRWLSENPNITMQDVLDNSPPNVSDLPWYSICFRQSR